MLQFHETPNKPVVLVTILCRKFRNKLSTLQVLSSESEGINNTKCIAVNPGRLAKGEGGGTFVELDYCGDSNLINASIVGI